MFLSLNHRKHEMCEMVSKCSRKIDHYCPRSNDQNKAQLSLSSVRYIFFVKCMLKMMKKDVPYIPSVAEAYKKRPPPPALPIGRGGIGVSGGDKTFLRLLKASRECE